MGLQQKKRTEQVQCVSGEQPAAERRMNEEPELVRGSVPGRWDTPEWLWPAPCESVEPPCRWPAASLEANGLTGAAAWRRCEPSTGRRLWPGCSGRAAVCRMSSSVCRTAGRCSGLAAKRRCCMRLSGWCRRSEGCARGAGCECGSFRPSQCFSRGSRTASWSRWSHQATWAAVRLAECFQRRRQ